MAYFVLAVLALAAGGVIGFLCGRMECLHSLLNGKTVTFAGQKYAVREISRYKPALDPRIYNARCVIQPNLMEERVEEFIQEVEEHNAAVNAAPHRETFRERLKREHLERLDEGCWGGVDGCPEHFGYENHSPCLFRYDPEDGDEACRDCWDREIPEENPFYWADGEE